jgi:hypothetical protein
MLLPRLGLDCNLPSSASWVDGIISMSYHAWFVFWDRVSLTFFFFFYLGWPQITTHPTPLPEFLSSWGPVILIVNYGGLVDLLILLGAGNLGRTWSCIMRGWLQGQKVNLGSTGILPTSWPQMLQSVPSALQSVASHFASPKQRRHIAEVSAFVSCLQSSFLI